MFTPHTDLPFSPLVQSAIKALASAVTVQRDEKTLFIEERSVWEPTSWLVQCCWETLAKAGAGDETLVVAHNAALRQPLAPLQALHRLAQQV